MFFISVFDSLVLMVVSVKQMARMTVLLWTRFPCSGQNLEAVLHSFQENLLQDKCWCLEQLTVQTDM